MARMVNEWLAVRAQNQMCIFHAEDCLTPTRFVLSAENCNANIGWSGLITASESVLKFFITPERKAAGAIAIDF
jgi:hypothetical protein